MILSSFLQDFEIKYLNRIACILLNIKILPMLKNVILHVAKQVLHVYRKLMTSLRAAGFQLSTQLLNLTVAVGGVSLLM